MKRILLLFILTTNFLWASTGWYDDLITINGTQFYIGGSSGSATQLDGHNFGTLLTLQISLADMKYWSDTQDRTGGAFYWEIKDQSNSTSISGPHEVLWSHASIGGNDYRGTWSGSIDVLAGLSANTTYKLNVWAKSWGTDQGDSWLSNNSNNYVATFITDAGLPVELTTFNASILESEVILNWETATEVNNFGFEIQKQKIEEDKTVKWKKIGFVEGSGNSNSVQNYSFSDNSITKGIYQYRLKQIDVDGKFEYSDVVEINFEIPTELALKQNYPNPFNPSTTIEFSLPEAGAVKLDVFNSIGEKVGELLKKNMDVGLHDIRFNAENLQSGIYFYRIQFNDVAMFKKMILLK